ncbi:unnamed protein product [Calicophoron daubneyi]|uniref:Vacuolar protein sorting-associated protein 33A n=1 Tax=Calicophoron daubneyi TaxID=300641 RepID=A0AAV2TEQ4_CALDB
MDYLSSGPLDLTQIKLSYQNDLLNHLDKCQAPTAIYWEKSLMSPVGLIVGHSSLKEHGVSNSFILDNAADSYSPPESKSVVFIISPTIKIVDVMQTFVTRDSQIKRNTSKEYHIIAIPSFSYACKTFLSEKNLLKAFTSIYEFPLTLLPLDTDVLSLEDPDCYAKCTLHQKQQGIYRFVQGLMRFQSLYGLFPTIRAKGSRAKEVARMLIRMRHEADVAATSKLGSPMTEMDSQTDMLVILDRSVDVLTPLLSQLTYEGLVDEKWGIHYGTCRASVSESSAGDQLKRVQLNSADEVFSELRDQSFSCVGSILARRSKEIAAIASEAKNSKRITELRRVVDRLPEIQAMQKELGIHTMIAEQLKKYAYVDEFLLSLAAQKDFLSGFETDKAHPYIEDCILRVAPLNEVIRLMCIQSFCNGGLKQRLLEYYKREILQVYGFEHMFTIDNLNRSGLLNDSNSPQGYPGLHHRPGLDKISSDSTGYSNSRQTVTAVSAMFNTSLKRNLRLLVPPTGSADSGSDPEQMLSAVYSGYIPISVRLVQAMAIGWLPKTVSSIAGHLTNAGPSNAMALKANAILAGKRLISGFRFDDGEAADQTRTSFSYNPIQSTTLDGNGFPLPTTPSDGSNFITTLTPGVEFEDTQVSDTSNSLTNLLHSSREKTTTSSKSRVVVVAFVGGVTRAEVSALRILAASGEANLEFVIVTTGFLTAQTFVESMSQHVQKEQLIPF